MDRHALGTHASDRSRRHFLQTFAFSAAAGLARVSSSAGPSSTLAIDRNAHHMLLLGDWGADGSAKSQKAVAQAMSAYCKEHAVSPEALFFLGDNFYGTLAGGISSPRWRTQFEETYSATDFNCRCYAVLGNHDYHAEPLGKHDAQLAYAREVQGTRWTMPSKWYRFDFPREQPVATFVALDSNYRDATAEKLALTAAERTSQAEWLEAELAKPPTTPFLILCAHHPIYSNGDHGDDPSLAKKWDALMRQHRAHLYICGHDHDLQHLEFAGHPTSFVISGGGGAGVLKLPGKSKAEGRFGEAVHGFTHLQASRGRLVISHVDAEGRKLHSFSKDQGGAVQLL